MQLLRLRFAILVDVDPDPQLGVNPVAGVYPPVVIAALARQIVDRERQEAVWVGGPGLRRPRREHVRPIAAFAIGVWQDEPAVPASRIGPRHRVSGSV